LIKTYVLMELDWPCGIIFDQETLDSNRIIFSVTLTDLNFKQYDG